MCSQKNAWKYTHLFYSGKRRVAGARRRSAQLSVNKQRKNAPELLQKHNNCIEGKFVKVLGFSVY